MKDATHYPRLLILPQMTELVYLVTNNTDIAGHAFCSLILSLYPDLTPKMKEEIFTKMVCAPATIKDKRNIWCASVSDTVPIDIPINRTLTGSSYVFTVHDNIKFSIIVDDLPEGLVQLVFAIEQEAEHKRGGVRSLCDLLEIASSFYDQYKDGQHNNVILTETYTHYRRIQRELAIKANTRSRLRVIQGDVR